MKKSTALKVLLFIIAIASAGGGMVVFAMGMQSKQISVIIVGPAISFGGFLVMSLMMTYSL